MIALLVVGCILGYLLVGGVASVVVTAWDLAEDGTTTSGYVAFAVVLWPLLAAAVLVYGSLLFPMRAIGRSWLWSVKKLNPNFKEVTSS